MASLDLPYRCPRCGEHKRFRSLSSLRAHLEYNHTYETLYVLSKTNSICDAAVFPLAADGALLTPAARRDYFESTSFQGKDQRFSCDLVPADELEPAPSSSPSPRYVHEIEIPLTEIFTRGKAVAPAPAPPATMDTAYEEGLARLKIRAFEKLEVDKRLEKLTEEVEQKIASQVGRLQVELDRKSSELEKAKQESLRLSREKQELEDRASELSRQVDVSVEMLASLKQDLVQKEQELTRKQQEVLQIDQFLKETAAREANAKVRLQHFIEELLDRADRAEKQLQIISSSCGTTPNGSLGRCGTPATKAIARPVPLRAQRERHPGPGVAVHGPYGVSNQRSSSSTGASSRAKAVSQSSGCYDSDSAEPCPTDDTADGHPYAARDGARGSGLRRQAIQNWHRRPYRNSTEGEEGDVSDVGSRTTESEAEGWEPEAPGSAVSRPPGSCRLTVATDAGCPTGRPEGAGGKVCRLERGSPGHSSEVISPEILKMRAALFCIFTYLDTKTLLRAAEVCKDWKFVARHPAVWTRVLLENARVSSKFLAMLSQWCTQMHSLTLQNLKPRQRGKKESKEDYMKSTRGCLEAGLESLLKATGSNLLILRISHCPNVLTDRSLWLASCYCRALQAVTYRSSTDPVGHEVIWALGAGCRDIISLQVAPLHPCQQPTRFSNRCLQMIGRCWPHLRALGVGGAGCGVQGLASLARNCMRLQVLELDHVAEINQEVAAEVCREGLKGLEMLVLTSTPVTPKALLHFNSVCRNLKSIVVQVGIVDYFKEPHSPEARKMFEEMVNKLQALRKRPGFSKILHIKVEGGC
ncbi:F-box only protein 41 isoform X1 [Corvus hawaiiensis]|uniref:F-box only protein 41 n=1 Tax=Corvus moneduloides TaxID=1196302 RepID=A0A8C3E7X1_CORMO|nr:F-box only protein 41 isoform X1 [Corvus moneduloides]XP_031964672.1 F-box only protein 41 isoform X1 [Corvus moneduloides]XP_048159567.1 F-box only protein 41 isoform X1 [Corvus hawaiiensis]XP_048159568.1 F-box only protein 41 isoform X1 [Corvus hawaiiensis]XP_048159569.1 F-box only protein 41 isoform X1 [Corvus hawaiiensis]